MCNKHNDVINLNRFCYNVSNINYVSTQKSHPHKRVSLCLNLVPILYGYIAIMLLDLEFV